MSNLQIYKKHYDSHLNAATKTAKTPGQGGQIRSTTGNLVESLAELIWVTETGGTVKREKHPASNRRGARLNFSVDKNCYSVNNQLKLVLECKAYLDSCFLSRADNDLGMIKATLDPKNKNVQFGILALENACSEDAINFYKGNNNIDEIFFLLDGKRRSSEPIWKKKYRKSMNMQKLKDFVDYVNSLK